MNYWQIVFIFSTSTVQVQVQVEQFRFFNIPQKCISVAVVGLII